MPEKTQPHFNFEKTLEGDFCVVGIDEVGRGALAGPVVAGAVCLQVKGQVSLVDWTQLGINDSKKLSAKKREELAFLIQTHAVAWGVGETSVAIINKVGIVKATERAMRQAIAVAQKNLPSSPTFLLIDAFHLKRVKGVGLKNQQALIHGDSLSLSIAAASIVAKVYRDSLMVRLHKNYPHYGWNEGKGYGTKAHLLAVKTYGICKLHRTLFVRGIIC